ncbi:hypothetical protein BU26DRAFT_398639, partial [Trematosphaeria pertusa]
LIQDLCTALSTAHPACFGFLNEDGHRFVVYPDSQTSTIASGAVITLDKLLHPLTRRKRYFLALTIASWFLRLGCTPWLRSPLKVNVVFLQDAAPSGSSGLGQPYIRGELSKHSSRPATDATSCLALQWSKEVGEEAGPDFAEVIEWCLRAKSLNDQSWRKEMWSNVIVPLDACHKQVTQRP